MDKSDARVRGILSALELSPPTRGEARRHSSSTKTRELACGASRRHVSSARPHAGRHAGARAPQKRVKNYQ